MRGSQWPSMLNFFQTFIGLSANHRLISQTTEVQGETASCLKLQEGIGTTTSHGEGKHFSYAILFESNVVFRKVGNREQRFPKVGINCLQAALAIC